MTANQPLSPGTSKNLSETSILIFSFIIAFSAGIIIISTLFVTIKKIETKFSKQADVIYVVRK